MTQNDNLRISFIAGGLSKGGAEKQFLYILRASQEAGIACQVITLTRGEFYEDALSRLGVQLIFAGTNSVTRVRTILRAARSFHPHFLQASHFFASFYAGAAGRLSGIPSIGAIRSDLFLDLEGVGRPGSWLLQLPNAYLANSHNARENAPRLGLPAQRVHVLQNVIDLEPFDALQSNPGTRLLQRDKIHAVTVARLVPVKRLERFLHALALARQQAPQLVGVVIGDGPSAPELHVLAETLDLRPDHPDGGIRFLGERDDIPRLLFQADLFVLTSDREGFPNVFLEAMAASLPIVATPAGETRELVMDGTNGYIVPFDDTPALARRLVNLTQSPELRSRLGQEGRRIVERQFSYPRLKSNLLEAYRSIARQTHNQAALSILDKGFSLEQRKVTPIS